MHYIQYLLQNDNILINDWNHQETVFITSSKINKNSVAILMGQSHETFYSYFNSEPCTWVTHEQV